MLKIKNGANITFIISFKFDTRAEKHVIIVKYNICNLQDLKSYRSFFFLDPINFVYVSNVAF